MCESPGGTLVFEGPKFRLIRVDEADFPAFYRLVWNDHVGEFSDLTPADRTLCMEAVAHAERIVRSHLQPEKMNLASLGNVVPHLHWHIIARFQWDSHFPGPVWSAAQRDAPAGSLAEVVARRASLEQDLANQLGRLA